MAASILRIKSDNLDKELTFSWAQLDEFSTILREAISTSKR